MTSDGGFVTAVLPSGAELALVSRDDPSRPSDVSFEGLVHAGELFRVVQEFAGVAVDSLKKLSPDEFELEFGIGVTASSGKLMAFVVSGAAEASIGVRVLWKKDKAPDAP